MNKDKFIFRKTHDIDKQKFATLLMDAKGGRTMKDFACECGVNPSTFTRIIQQANKGASSSELLESIALHADPKSGVTLEKLATANGYTIEIGMGTTKANKIISYFDNAEMHIRDVLIQGLIDRGAEVRMGNIRYQFSKSLGLSPDALIMTNAFGEENSVWFIDSLIATPRKTYEENHPIHKSRIKQIAFDKISRFVFIYMNNIELFKPTRYSLVVFDKEVFDIIVEEFSETYVVTDISIIHIDKLNSCIASEFLLPRLHGGYRTSYFLETPVKTDNIEYLRTDIDEE